MQNITNLLISTLLIFGSSSCTLADTSISKQPEIKSYDEIMADADVIHLDGSVIIEKKSGYQVKSNSTSLTSLQEERNTYIEKSSIRGINKTGSSKYIITLIPLYKLRGVNDPAKKIRLVTVNKKAVKYTVFLPGKDSNRAIRIAKENFGDSTLFSTQLHPAAPILFIDAGNIQPNESIYIDYQVKTTGEIRVRR
jgi:hypothetical protein